MRGNQALLLLLLAGCGTTNYESHVEHPLQQDPVLSARSAGVIGCPPNEIQISDYQSVLRTIG